MSSPPQRQPPKGDADYTEPHLINHIATSTLDSQGRSHDVRVTTEIHYDVYEDELGEGTPMYDAWVIEDDKTGATADAKYENLGRAAEASAAGRGFRTPAGRPSSNELWRFRLRGCQDCWAALFFFGLLFVVVLWGSSELYHFSLSNDMLDTIRSNLDLTPARGKSGDEGDDGGLGTVAASEDVVAAVPFVAETHSPSVAGKGKQKKEEAVRKGEEPQEINILNVAFSGWSLRRVAWVLTWSAVSMGVACVGLSIFRYMPRFLIVLECWVEFGLLASIGLVACLSGNLFGAILFATLSLFPLLWLYLIQDRIPFAVCLLKIASRVVQRHTGLVIVSVGVAAVLVLYTMLIICFMAPAMLRAVAESSNPQDGAYLFILLFSLLWVEQVLVNVVHVTASGVVATWYFAGDSHMPEAPVRASFRRATRSSIGSICFGSLLVAIVRFLRFLVEATRGGGDDDDCGFFGCVCDCFLHLLEAALRYFNVYAFVHVAIYGCSYVDAARRTWALTQQCFFAAVFNDSLVYQAVVVLRVMLAGAVGLIGGVLCGSVGLGLYVFMISLFINSIVFQLVESTVTTLFVCFAEVPEGMEVSFPELYAELVAADSIGAMSGVNNRNQASYGTL